MPSSSTLTRASALALAATRSLPLVSGAVLPRASEGPCDIYAAGNTPCVAAHSTTRALYGAYSGPLYQVVRDSDGQTVDVAPLGAGGVADAGAQDAFCAGTTCLIATIYDQSGTGNDLTRAPKGYFSGPQPDGSDNLAAADGAPIMVGGQKAYGVFVSPGTGYRNNNAKSTAIGDAAEGMYAVIDGTHFNDVCCFDYGNAETSSLDTGNGHMEAIYYGANSAWGSGSGAGPWVMADLENGLFSGTNPKNNPNNPSISSRFVTSIVKSEPGHWAIRGGDANAGELSSYHDGPNPDAPGYNPMSKEGAIILGIGGDNSNGGQGTFYEGVMTSSYPSDDTENAVQANIVAAGYATAPMMSGRAMEVGSTITLRATTSGHDTKFLTHSNGKIAARDVSTTSTDNHKSSATWTVRTGLGNAGCVSFESVDSPGSFLHHADFGLKVASGSDKAFKEDATFCPQAGLNGGGNDTVSIRSWNHPTRFVRHFEDAGHLASNGGINAFDDAERFGDDVTFVVGEGF